MQVKTKGTLTGIKRGKGDSIIEGKDVQWDYTSFFILSDLPESKGNAKGMATTEYKFGKSTEFDKWAHNDFPIPVDLDLVITTDGKQKQSVTVVAIVTAAPQFKKAA